MFFKKLRDTFKIKSGLTYVQKKIEEPRRSFTGKKGITRVGCIVDMDHFQNTEAFYELVKEFSLNPNAIKIIGYKKKKYMMPYTIPVYSDKDLGWKGTLHNKDVAEFLKQEYDLLINYYEDDNVMLKLLSVKTPARLKVGLGTLDARLNDLILHLPLNDFNGFKNELKKYLNVLNEL